MTLSGGEKQKGQLVHQTDDKATISESLIEQVYEVKVQKWFDGHKAQEMWQFRL